MPAKRVYFLCCLLLLSWLSACSPTTLHNEPSLPVRPSQSSLEWSLPTTTASQKLEPIQTSLAQPPDQTLTSTQVTNRLQPTDSLLTKPDPFRSDLEIPPFLPESIPLIPVASSSNWQSTPGADPQLALKLQALQDQYNLSDQAVSLVYLEPGSQPAGYFLLADRIRTAGSTIKLPLALVILDEVAQGTFSFQDQIHYQASDYEAGSGSIQDQKPGTAFSLRDLLRRMIVDSDNIATNMLIRWTSTYLQEDVFIRLCKRYDIPKITAFAQTTARASMQALDELIRNPKNNPYYPELETWLRSAPVTYVGTGFPQSTQFPHKYGLFAETYSEVLAVNSKHSFFLSIYVDASEVSEDAVLLYLREVGRICFAFSNR